MNILVTGPPGSGKTTAVRKAADRLQARGVHVAGFVTEEVRQEGRRVGFDLVVLDGPRVALARVGWQTPVTVARYGVDVDAVEQVGLAALENERARVLVIDEIAPMELAAPSFLPAVEAALDGPAGVLATVHARAGGAVAELRGRADVRLVDLAAVDRDALPARLAEQLAPAADQDRQPGGGAE